MDFNSSPAAAHLYFWQDNSWGTPSAPDDEASGTDIILGGSTNLTVADDLSNTNVPAGTPSGSTYYGLSLNGTDESAHATGTLVNWGAGADNGDHTTMYWVKMAAVGPASDSYIGGHGASIQAYQYVQANGSVRWFTPGGSNLDSSAGDITTNTWKLIALVADNNGSAGADDVLRIYVGGVQVASRLTGGIDNVAGTQSNNDEGWPNSGTATEIHAAGVWHSALTEAQIREYGCCGVNGEANPTNRDALMGAAVDCSTY
jgi:hypothetical protein